MLIYAAAKGLAFTAYRTSPPHSDSSERDGRISGVAGGVGDKLKFWKPEILAHRTTVQESVFQFSRNAAPPHPACAWGLTSTQRPKSALRVCASCSPTLARSRTFPARPCRCPRQSLPAHTRPLRRKFSKSSATARCQLVEHIQKCTNKMRRFRSYLIGVVRYRFGPGGQGEGLSKNALAIFNFRAP